MADRPLLALGEIEDEHRAILAADCLKAGFAPEWVESADTASVNLGTKGYDVLLFHLMTPGAAAVAIKARGKLARGRFPVIALSEEVDEGAFARAYRAGADDVIPLGQAGVVAARLTEVPRPSRLPPGKSRGEALVADPDKIRAELLERVLVDAGYRVEVVADELATKLNMGRPQIRLIVVDTGIGDAVTLHEQSRSRGTKATWILRTKPDQVAELSRRLAMLGSVAVTSSYGPPDDVLFEANRLAGTPGAESRADARLLYGAVVAFREPGKPGTMHGFSYNISPHGLYVRTLVQPAGDTVSLEITPPGADEPINLSGQIAWRRNFGPTSKEQAPPGFGVQLSGGNLHKWAAAYRQLYKEFRGSLPPEFPSKPPAAPEASPIASPKPEPSPKAESPSSPKAAALPLPNKPSQPEMRAVTLPARKDSPPQVRAFVVPPERPQTPPAPEAKLAQPPPPKRPPSGAMKSPVVKIEPASSPAAAAPPEKERPTRLASPQAQRAAPKKESLKTMIGGVSPMRSASPPPRAIPLGAPPAKPPPPRERIAELSDADIEERSSSVTALVSEVLAEASPEPSGDRPLEVAGGFDLKRPGAGQVLESERPSAPETPEAIGFGATLIQAPASSFEPPTVPKDLAALGRMPPPRHDPSAAFKRTAVMPTTADLLEAKGAAEAAAAAVPAAASATPPETAEAEPVPSALADTLAAPPLHVDAQPAAPAPAEGAAAPQPTAGPAWSEPPLGDSLPPSMPPRKRRPGIIMAVIAILGGIAIGAVLALQAGHEAKPQTSAITHKAPAQEVKPPAPEERPVAAVVTPQTAPVASVAPPPPAQPAATALTPPATKGIPLAPRATTAPATAIPGGTGAVATASATAAAPTSSAAPTASAAPPASEPTLAPAPPAATGDIPEGMAHLIVESPLDTNVFVHGKLVGRTNVVNVSYCGTRFIRLGTELGHWENEGVVFKIVCGKENRLKLE